MKKVKRDDAKLDPEEEDILTSFEKDEWKSIKNVEKEKQIARKTAASFQRNKKRPQDALT